MSPHGFYVKGFPKHEVQPDQDENSALEALHFAERPLESELATCSKSILRGLPQSMQ